MCLLIVLHRIDAAFPILVASNRDEARSRGSTPPGLYVGERRRMLSPRDRRAGGTWLAVNDRGMFAGITNIAGASPRDVPTTRGELPHLALDHDDAAAAARAVAARCADQPFNAFQLLIADREEMLVVLHEEGRVEIARQSGGVATLSNEHRLGALHIPAVDAACAPDLPSGARLDRLAALLLDEGALSGHRIRKVGGEYGTVSSSLLAIPLDPNDPWEWRYAPGDPGEVGYRAYGNLARRLRG
ncbi:MAG: NRDE family protein [Planctomycetes bacterium]|nr:NRDE family protein [Planctomycetota bacterium]MCB9870948.1 NRDE family protein [Planctomycetota bacterium]MCB9888312.1 NRDE family protein [Planctomycetota bacterium]